MIDPEFNSYIFSNNPSNPRLMSLLEMFYRGVLQNTVGIMEAKNKLSGEEVLLLVGLSQNDEGQTDTYPIARILGPEDAYDFAAPTGSGEFFDDTVENA